MNPTAQLPQNTNKKMKKKNTKMKKKKKKKRTNMKLIENKTIYKWIIYTYNDENYIIYFKIYL